MAKTARIDLEAITRAGQRALSSWISPQDLPAKYRNPQVYKMVLDGLAKDLPSHVATGRDFQAAYRAVSAWSASQQLLETASRLYHDPRVRAIANNDEATMQYYWNNPDKLMPVLAKHSVDFPKSYRNNGPVAEVMQVLGQYQTFDADHASSGPEMAERAERTPVARESVSSSGAARSGAAALDRSRPPAKPSPGSNGANSGKATKGKEPRSYEELIAAKTLTPGQWARLSEMAEERHPAEDSEFDLLPDSYFGETEETATNE